MKPLLTLASLVICSLSLGCRASGARHDVPCTCGQPEADIEGCAHEKCVAGERNPDNPDCVCGTLTIPK
jgi:hypothetical protein